MAFEFDVLSLVNLENQIDEMQKKIKILKTDHKDISGRVLAYMQDQNNFKCETPTMNFLVRESVGVQSLSMAMLKEVFENYFPRHPDISEGLLTAIAEHRKKDQQKKFRLKKIKRRV
jgi:hypothetical protein